MSDVNALIDGCWAHFCAQSAAAAHSAKTATATKKNSTTHPHPPRDVQIICDSGFQKHIQRAGSNGVLKSFAVVAGTPETCIQLTSSPMREYTLFHLSRYGEIMDDRNDRSDNDVGAPLKPGKTAKHERIVQSDDGGWISGFWRGFAGVAYRGNDWVSSIPAQQHDKEEYYYPEQQQQQEEENSRPKWTLSVDYAFHHRSNGFDVQRDNENKNTNENDPIHTILPVIGINFPNCVEWERSHFQVAEILIFDYTLSLDAIRRLEMYFATKYGIEDMLQGGGR